tara:strand:+ start:1382 stop:1678 length:297 start_codon:yes stop_codon:yes gene_type:complete
MIQRPEATNANNIPKGSILKPIEMPGIISINEKSISFPEIKSLKIMRTKTNVNREIKKVTVSLTFSEFLKTKFRKLAKNGIKIEIITIDSVLDTFVPT